MLKEDKNKASNLIVFSGKSLLSVTQTSHLITCLNTTRIAGNLTLFSVDLFCKLCRREWNGLCRKDYLPTILDPLEYDEPEVHVFLHC